jgi:hypothetical protein
MEGKMCFVPDRKTSNMIFQLMNQGMPREGGPVDSGESSDRHSLDCGEDLPGDDEILGFGGIEMDDPTIERMADMAAKAMAKAEAASGKKSSRGKEK